MLARPPILFVTLLTLAAPAGAAPEADDAIRARDDRIAELERKVDVLVDELAAVRTQVAVPDEPELKSQYGLGPAASKIYGVERGLSIGGYGEAFYTNFVGHSGEARDRADFLRFVAYLGYKFSERIVFNTEIEFEHATTSATASAGGGSVSVEFATLDFLWRDEVNARAGLLLVPMGFVNEIHEPPFFFGVQRPETERRIIPSTWRENGVGIFGQLGEQLEYRAYVMSGFNAAGYSSSGVRGGRQNGNRSLAEDLAFVVRADWIPTPEWKLGGSFYTGDGGQDQSVGGVDLPASRLTMWEAHAQYRRGPLHARALFAWSALDDAGDLSRALGLGPTAGVAEEMLGGYGEVAYDVWPLLSGDGEKSLEPFFRLEYVDTQFEAASGFSADRSKAFWLTTAGIQFRPHPNVVLKMEYRNFAPRDGEIPDELSLGMGFAF